MCRRTATRNIRMSSCNSRPKEGRSSRSNASGRLFTATSPQRVVMSSMVYGSLGECPGGEPCLGNLCRILRNNCFLTFGGSRDKYLESSSPILASSQLKMPAMPPVARRLHSSSRLYRPILPDHLRYLLGS
ncbi:hypothetical protein EJB05_27248 [Eragrostis curvula]|uniref:Uncharacterized protein n=1 Tax=Eragrostis curvula TaxID=38414 RepID=A0A5J9UNF8_9POAL|nr:hypothetical protein EJB05_27248 [Eragrostis curvula]